MGTPADQSAIDVDQTALGLVSESQYESPQYGTSVEWPTPEISYDVLVSDEDSGIDLLRLQDDDETFSVLVRSFPADGATVDDGVTFWAEEYGQRWDQSTTLLQQSGDDVGGVVVQFIDDAGNDVVQYIEIYAVPGGDALIEVILTVAPDQLQEALAVAQEVELNEASVFQTFATEEVLAEA